jgi:hypothetical protein
MAGILDVSRPVGLAIPIKARCFRQLWLVFGGLQVAELRALSRHTNRQLAIFPRLVPGGSIDDMRQGRQCLPRVAQVLHDADPALCKDLNKKLHNLNEARVEFLPAR